jgi:hypothetical protein
MPRKPLPSSDERHSLSFSRRYLGNVEGGWSLAEQRVDTAPLRGGLCRS